MTFDMKEHNWKNILLQLRQKGSLLQSWLWLNEYGESCSTKVANQNPLPQICPKCGGFKTTNNNNSTVWLYCHFLMYFSFQDIATTWHRSIEILVDWVMLASYQMKGALSLSSLTPENSHSCLSILSSWHVSRQLSTAPPFHTTIPDSSSCDH